MLLKLGRGLSPLQGAGGYTPPPSSFFLRADGSSFLLLADASSRLVLV